MSSSETFSFLLRPKGLSCGHHAAVTGFVLLNDVDILWDPSLVSSSHPILSPSPSIHRVTSNEPPPSFGPRLSLHSTVSSLANPGPTTLHTPSALITSSRDATLRIWDLSTPTPTCTGLLEGHTEWISDLLPLNDRRTLVSSSADSLIKLWDIQTGLCIQTLSKHSDYVECLSYSPHANILASAGLSNQIYIWRLDSTYPTPTECLSLTTHSHEACGSVYALDMAESGTMLATGGTDRIVRCWDVRTGRVGLKLLGHLGNVRGVSVNADGWTCVSVGGDNEIRLWDIRKQRCTASYHVKPPILHIGEVRRDPALTGQVKASCYTMTVNATFTKVYTGHSTGVIASTDLTTGRVEPLMALPSPVITVRLDERDQRLWVGDFDSTFSAYDVRPILTRHRSFDVDDPEEEEEESNPTLPPTSAAITLPGYPPLKRARITGDGWHVLSQDSIGCVHLWDVVSQRLLKSYGVTPFDPLLTRKNAAVTGKGVSPWFSVDVRLGCLCVLLDRRTAWSAVYVITSPPLPDEGAEVPGDVVVNLGESAVASVLAEWVGLERLALAVQSGLEWEEDGIEETPDQTPMFSPLLSPPRNLPSPPLSPLGSVRSALIISYPRVRRPPLYLALPIPSLPPSLSPRSPSIAEDRALELDRRRAIYYATVPRWVEERVMREMERAERPPEDLLPDVMVNVRDWVGEEEGEGDWWRGEGEEEEEEGDEDEDVSDVSSKRREDSTSHLHPASDPIRIQSSPPSSSRLPLSHSRHSLSSRSGRRGLLPLSHSPSASPIPSSRLPPLQHPSVPRVHSSGSLHTSSPLFKHLSHSPLDGSFDLNALAGADHLGVTSPSPAVHSALDSDTPRVKFYLTPAPSASSAPSPQALPAVLSGPLLLPSSTTVRRVLQYLIKRLNNSPSLAVEVTEESVELLMERGVLKWEETWEEVREKWEGEGGGGGGNGMRVWYRRKEEELKGPKGERQVTENGHSHAVLGVE